MDLRAACAILGLPSEGASAGEARAAFLRRARLYHPDKHSTGTGAEQAIAAAHFRELKEAFETISRPSQRDAPAIDPDMLGAAIKKMLGKATTQASSRKGSAVVRAEVRLPQPLGSYHSLIPVAGDGNCVFYC